MGGSLRVSVILKEATKEEEIVLSTGEAGGYGEVASIYSTNPYTDPYITHDAIRDGEVASDKLEFYFYGSTI